MSTIQTTCFPLLLSLSLSLCPLCLVIMCCDTRCDLQKALKLTRHLNLQTFNSPATLTFKHCLWSHPRSGIITIFIISTHCLAMMLQHIKCGPEDNMRYTEILLKIQNLLCDRIQTHERLKNNNNLLGQNTT